MFWSHVRQDQEEDEVFLKTMVNKEKQVHEEEFGEAGGLLAQGKRQDQEEDEVFMKRSRSMRRRRNRHEE